MSTDERSTHWAMQATWAVTGVALAVLVFEMIELRSVEVRGNSFLALAQGGNTEELLEEIGDAPDPNVATPEGWTALHYASFFGHRKAVEALIAAGAQAGARSRNGQTPLHRAALKGDPKIAELLVAAGADVDAAAADGSTPLFVALRRGHAGLARYLIESGASVSGRDPRTQMTALHFAAGGGDLSLVQLLLSAGADPNAAYNDSNTPLHIAAAASDGTTAGLLLRYGADATRRNASGKRPGELAAEAGADVLSELLSDHVQQPIQ